MMKTYKCSFVNEDIKYPDPDDIQAENAKQAALFFVQSDVTDIIDEYEEFEIKVEDESGNETYWTVEVEKEYHFSVSKSS